VLKTESIIPPRVRNCKDASSPVLGGGNTNVPRGKDDIEKVLASLTLEDSDTKRRPNQLPLIAIKENCQLLRTLERVVSLEPVLKVMNKKEINIRYSDFKV